MIPFDQLGNVLLKDDLVAVQSGDQTLLGLVVDIKESSTIAASKAMPMGMPGQVRIALLPMTIPFMDASPRLMNITKVVKPPDFNKRPS